MTVSLTSFLDALRQHRLLDEEQRERIEVEFRGRGDDPEALVSEVQKREWLTPYQVEQVLLGQAAELSLGQHVLIDLLGEGGMGRVFKARHRRLKRLDAIKLIRPDRVISRVTLERFFREAEVIARLDHPNIVRIYDAAEEGDRHYLVMEFVSGVDLAQLINMKGALPVAQASACIRQAALGLQHAYEKGLVHRDIKPSNLFLARGAGDPRQHRHGGAPAVIKILDLGLARLNEQHNSGGGLTRQGQMMGTPDYVAPEQAEDASNVDIRADIYSLGCTFYQLLAGQPPFPGGTLIEKLTKHTTIMPERLPDLDGVVWGILTKMMAKPREGRYADPAAVAEALAPFADAELEAPPTQATASVPVSASAIRETRGSATPAIPQTLDSPTADRSSLGRKTGPSTVPLSGPMAGASVVVPSSQTTPREGGPILAPSLSRTGPDQATLIGVSPAVLPPKEKPPRRLLVPLLLGVALLVGAIVAAILWPRNRESNPLAQRDLEATKDLKGTDPTKDKKKSTKEDPSRRTTEEKKPSGRKPDDGGKPPDRPRLPGDGKAAPSGGPPRGAEKRTTLNEATEVAHDKPRGPEEHLDPWGTIAPRTTAVVFSFDGKVAATRNLNTVSMFDLIKRQPVETVSPFNLTLRAVEVTKPLGPIAVSPDGQRYVCALLGSPSKVPGKTNGADYDTLVRVDRGGKPMLFYGDAAGNVDGKPALLTRCLAYSPDGKHLVAAWPKKVVRWDPTGMREFETTFASLPQDINRTECLAWTPDSKRFVTGCADGGLYLLPAALDGEGALAILQGHPRAMRAMAFADDTTLVSMDAGGTVCEWSLPEGKSVTTLKPRQTREGWHPTEVHSLAATKNLFATGGENGMVQLGKFDAKEYLKKFDLKDRVLALTFVEDGKKLIAATEKQFVVISPEPPPVATGKGAAEEKPGDRRGKGKTELPRD